jgi:hypothetical protein
MTNVLIEQLYTNKECEIIRDFFLEDELKKNLISKAISSKLITSRDVISANPIDELFLICLSAGFADSEDECHRIALTIFQFHKKVNILPSLCEDFGLTFANKTLMSLSFFPQVLEFKRERHGAPSPDFYRKISKNIFINQNQHDIASHHEQWENFLFEVFV